MKNTLVIWNVWRTIFFLILCFLIGSPAFAGELLYSLTTIQRGNVEATVDFNILSTNLLVEKLVIDVPLPRGQTVSGVIMRTLTGAGRSPEADSKETSRIIVSFERNAGSLELLVVDEKVTGMILHDTVDKKIFRARVNSNGQGILKEEDANAYQCVDFPMPPEPDTGILYTPPTSALIPDISTLQNLESRPGASKTLYINYWGGTISDTAWNDRYNSGYDINYTPYSYGDGDTTTFSETERYLMWLGWRETAEDYAAFDINVTTMQAVYDATAIVNRSQLIATTTNYFYTGAGGVAFVGIFNNTSDYYKTAWTWNSSGGSMGMTHSHEAGHQMGLWHDGTSSVTYYRGHGVWGPIMGAPFYKEYVQWSKGDYPDANNSNDDLIIIANVLGAVPDDAGNSTATATNLSFPVTDYKGQITPDGLSGDIDVYSFIGSGETHVEIKTILGDEGENRAANLAMDVMLKDSQGGIVASMTSSDHTPLDPTTNTFVYDGNLTTGTYYIIIDANSPDANWTTGFDEYGNGGEYRLTISGTSPYQDLVVQFPGVSDSSLTPGQIFTASATVMNQGTADSDSTTLHYYHSTDSTINTSDTEIATSSVGPLVPGGTSPESAVVTAPAIDGTYWIGACVDAVSGESNTDNNCSSGVQIIVTSILQGDAYEPDNSAGEATIIENGISQTHSIIPVGDEDWVKFTLASSSEVILETSGPSGDSRMWLYDSSLTEVEYNDDYNSLWSRIDRTCGTDELPAGTYYVKIDEYADDGEIPSYDLILTAISCDDKYDTDINDWVQTMALQPDGKLLIGGFFTDIGGVTRNRIARLNTDGSLDTSFNPVEGANTWVATMLLQPDGKVLIGGNFSSVGGVTRNHIARLNVDGSLDAGFDPGTGISGNVRAIALQPDGKILVGGWFGVVRLNPDGSFDATFIADVNGGDYAFAMQTDGKILISGNFTGIGSVARHGIARLNTNGSLDKTFDPGMGVNGTVYAMALQPDGKVLIGGDFTQVNSVDHNYIARLNINGSLDTSFNPNLNDLILAISQQADGKVLIGGFFTEVNSATRNRIARLNTDGSLDADFDPGMGVNGSVETMVLQTDGKLVIGGHFTEVNGVVKKYIARLDLAETALQDLSVATDGQSVTWLLDGASPSMESVTFEVSDNLGGDWALLGNGQRIAGGWSLEGLNLPVGQNYYIRARGYYGTNASSIMESILQFYLEKPSIQVSNTVTPSVLKEPGGSVTFNAAINNTSATNTVIIDTLTDTIHGNLNGKGNCSVPRTIVAGSRYSCTFNADITGSAGISETNTVTASGADEYGNPVSGSDSATVKIIKDGGCVYYTPKNKSPMMICW